MATRNHARDFHEQIPQGRETETIPDAVLVRSHGFCSSIALKWISLNELS
jgi:hypothetical protein